MAVLKNIKLGRAAYESIFELNPSGITYTPTRIEDMAHGLDGSGIDVNLSRNRPVLQIAGNYITPAQQNQFLSLLHIDYEPLVFEPLDFDGTNVWESWQERVLPINATQFYLPATSFTDAAKWKQLNGGGWTIKPVGLYDFMDRTHGREGGPINLLGSPVGIWGRILWEYFNLLPTGLLANAGKNWRVANGNGTTRDAFVSIASPIEGAKDILINSDGSGIYVNCILQNGALWHPDDPYYQRGHFVLNHDANWQAQMVGTSAGNHAAFWVDTDISGAPAPWVFGLTTNSPSSVDYEFRVNGVLVVSATALSNPYLPHAYRVVYDGTNIKAYVDVVEIYNQPVTIQMWNEFGFYGQSFNAEDIVKVDTININDGSGYDPSTGLVTLVPTGSLVAGQPYWFTYQYNALLCELHAIPLRVEGGWVGFSRYDFSLEGI